MVSDIVFLCLASICIYLIITTMMEKNILHFGEFLQNKMYKIQKNNKQTITNKEKSSSSYKNISEFSNKTESLQLLNESLTESLTQQKSNKNEIIEQKFISEDTEDLINEVINKEQNNKNSIQKL
jgi:hypothetical protein